MFENFFLPKFDALLLWGLVPRLISLIYLISFLSLTKQIIPWIGKNGISPISARFAMLKKSYPRVTGFFYKPSILWVCHDDWFLRALPWLGIIAAITGIWGGEFGWYGLLFCWIFYLSLADIGLFYPWDCLLLEVGFLALFLPTYFTLPILELTTPVNLMVDLTWRILIIRVMWGFAKIKFRRGTKDNKHFLKGFFAWMPIPNPIGWLVQHSWHFILIFLYVITFIIEVILPPLTLGTGMLRMIAVTGICSLMFGIFLTGNWGFFNVIFVIICLPLFVFQTSVLDVFSIKFFQEDLIVNLIMLFLLVGALGIYFAGNSYTTGTAPYLILKNTRLEKFWLLNKFLGLFRFLAPFRLIHSYGVFFPGSFPAIRSSLVIEGSFDLQQWQAYEYKFLPNSEKSRPSIVAPHHPRLDHLVFYLSSGATFADFRSAHFAFIPYNSFAGYSHFSWLDLVIQRLLEGNKSAASLFKNNTFTNHPPKYIRVTQYFLTPSSLKSLFTSGRWWHREFVGIVIPPRVSEPSIWGNVTPPPELLHPLQDYWKKKDINLKLILKSFSNNKDLATALLAHPDITSKDIEQFWGEYIPFIKMHTLADWETVQEQANTFKNKYSIAKQHLFERIWELYAYFLYLQLENSTIANDLNLMRTADPFYLNLVLKNIVGEGYPYFLQFYQENIKNKYLIKFASTKPAELIYPIAIIRYNQVYSYVRHLLARNWSYKVESKNDRIFNFLCQQKHFTEGYIFPSSKIFVKARNV